MKAPCTVPLAVKVKFNAAESAIAPPDAADHTQVWRVPEYCGALALPASIHPECDVMVSVAATAVKLVPEIRPI